jgi:hypothetical protein
VTLPAPFLDTACPEGWKRSLEEISRVNQLRLKPEVVAMKLRKQVVAALVLTGVGLAWNGVLHLFVLRAIEEPARQLFRRDLSAAQSVLLTVAIMVLFVFGYSRFRRTGGRGEGARYGFFFGLLAGVLVDGNQYILYPLPGEIALLWFCGGLLEFTVYGVIVSALVPSDGPPWPVLAKLGPAGFASPTISVRGRREVRSRRTRTGDGRSCDVVTAAEERSPSSLLDRELPECHAELDA